MRKTPYVLCAVTAVLALSASPAAAAEQVEPPAGPLVIELVTANGSGCPAGTASITVDPGNTFFTVTYSAFSASVGPDSVATDWRKNCQLNALVVAPDGFRYAVGQAVHNGYLSLATGATATQRSNHYFQGLPQTSYITHTFAGGADFDWQTMDEVPIAAQVWSPCGVQRNLNIGSEVRVVAGTSDTRTTTSLLTMDSAVYHLIWQTCP